MDKSFLTTLVREVRPYNPPGKCQKATDELRMIFDRQGFSSYTVHDGIFAGYEVSGGVQQAKHWFISVPSSAVNNLSSSGRVIVDPTVEQFSSSYFHEGESYSYVPDRHIPSNGLVYPSDDVYDAYTFE